jgi:hypothetical protein
MNGVTKMSAVQAATSLYEKLKPETSVYAVGIAGQAMEPVLVVYLASRKKKNLVPSEFEGFEVMTTITGKPSAKSVK